jgi:protein TonB
VKPQTQGLQLSLLIHGLVIAGVLGLSLMAGNVRRPVVIDFDLAKSIPAPPPPVQNPREVPSPKAVPPMLKKALPAEPPPVPREISRPLPAAEAPRTQETSPSWIHSTSDLTVPAENPGVPHVPGSFARAEGLSGSSGTASGSGRVGAGGGGTAEATAGEKARSRYLAEHFAFIRDKILQRVTYPPLARRMGWQGQVVLSFVIQLNGTIKETRVAQGSGHEVLDQNALEALRESVPFPQPPVEARISIPITYKLN